MRLPRQFVSRNDNKIRLPRFAHSDTFTLSISNRSATYLLSVNICLSCYKNSRLTKISSYIFSALP